MNFLGNAYLLSRSGDIIPVENHPIPSIEFDDILYILSNYGGTQDKVLAHRYRNEPTDTLKQTILSQYADEWCKVREWENGQLLTFRINSTDGFNWYSPIVNFLISNPKYSRSRITVEADKVSGARKTYWDEITYLDAVSPEFESILSAKLFSKDINDIVFL